jgi:hypothetical protein
MVDQHFRQRVNSVVLGDTAQLFNAAHDGFFLSGFGHGCEHGSARARVQDKVYEIGPCYFRMCLSKSGNETFKTFR